MLMASALFATGAHARSQLILPYPADSGLISAATYDMTGSRLGAAQFEIETFEDGRVEMTMVTGIDNGASNHASIVLEPIDRDHGHVSALVDRGHRPVVGDLPILRFWQRSDRQAERLMKGVDDANRADKPSDLNVFNLSQPVVH